MLRTVRVVFRSVEAGDESVQGHDEQLFLLGGARLRGIYAKATGLSSTPGDAYRVRVYGGPPPSSCWLFELVASSLAQEGRTADAMAQGLDLFLPADCFLTYQLLAANAAEGAHIVVDLLIEN